jgi:hypothetical protein
MKRLATSEMGAEALRSSEFTTNKAETSDQ